MFGNFSIRRRLIFLVAASAAAALGMAVASFYSMRHQLAALESVYQNQVQPASALSHLDSDLKDVRFRIAGVLLKQLPTVGSIQHLKDVRRTIAEQWSLFKKGSEGRRAGAEEAELVAKIDKGLAELLPPFLDKVEAAYARNDEKALAALLEDDWPQVQLRLVKPLSLLLPMKERAVKETYDESVETGARLMQIQVALALLGLLAVTALALFTTARITRGLSAVKSALERVQQGELYEMQESGQRDEFGQIEGLLHSTVVRLREFVGQVQRSAEELNEHSAKLLGEASIASERADGQADGITRVSANMEQNAVAITEVSQNAGAVAEAASEASSIAVQCKANMAQSLSAGQKIVDAVSRASTTIAKVSESVDRVGQSTGIIKDIAEQTNLLALNAAIEAARAGEHGRGFAVVSDEVRKLAERTAKSTSDITATVEGIRSVVEEAVNSIGLIRNEVQAGTALSQATDETLQKIVAAGDGLSKMAEQIAVAVKEQSSATEDVTHTMEKLATLTEENSSTIKQVDGTAESVAATASRMKEAVGRFRLSA